MNDANRLIVLITILINSLVRVQCECSLDLSKDFGTPSPVFLKNGNFLAPNIIGGAIKLRRSETVEVACPGTQRFIVLGNHPTSYKVQEAHCIINTTFRVDRQFVQFKDIRCNGQPWFTAQETMHDCNKNSKLYNVGYEVKKTFHTLYEACFDKYLLHTHYVKHHLSPMSVYMQNGVKRPNFIEGGLFGKAKMNEIYKMRKQEIRLNAILGHDMASKYLSKNQFLTRGHLAARADFTLSAETKATFHYVNTAPQWMRGNAGDWAALEEALRRRVKTHGLNVVVYTGTHSVMMLPDSKGRMRELYLHVDENNNPDVPVPMYNYKLVYDPINKTAAVFITINSSFYNDTIINSLTFCDDICENNRKYSWLRWRSNDGTFSFCCDYDQFVEEVNYLPKIDVRGRFF